MSTTLASSLELISGLCAWIRLNRRQERDELHSSSSLFPFPSSFFYARAPTFLPSCVPESSHPETGAEWRCDGAYLKYDELCAALLKCTPAFQISLFGSGRAHLLFSLHTQTRAHTRTAPATVTWMGRWPLGPCLPLWSSPNKASPLPPACYGASTSSPISSEDANVLRMLEESGAFTDTKPHDIQLVEFHIILPLENKDSEVTRTFVLVPSLSCST